ncbi:hypothetical protein P1X16_27790 [Hymenobacter sp. YC55]|nr:hypothetical protein [Hymenobacter sp. YC55]
MILGFLAESTLGGLKQAERIHSISGTFTPSNTGLDYLAVVCKDKAELYLVAASLLLAGLEP